MLLASIVATHRDSRFLRLYQIVSPLVPDEAHHAYTLYTSIRCQVANGSSYCPSHPFSNHVLWDFDTEGWILIQTGFLIQSPPGGGVVAQGLIVVVTYLFFMWTPMPDGQWRVFGALLVLLLASWGPVVLGFGSPLAASVLLMNTALGAFSFKAWLARNAES